MAKNVRRKRKHKKVTITIQRDFFEEPPVDISQFGDYRLGLTQDEIKEYLRRRIGKKALLVKSIYKKFTKAAGVNTMAIGPQGQSLMYRHDVKRFADLVLEGKPTYWD